MKIKDHLRNESEELNHSTMEEALLWAYRQGVAKSLEIVKRDLHAVKITCSTLGAAGVECAEIMVIPALELARDANET